MKGYPVPVKYPLEKDRPPLLWLLWVMPPIVHEVVKELTRGGRVVNRHPVTSDGMRAYQLTFEWWADSSADLRIRYSLRWHLILALEWMIKVAGLWPRYKDALGFYGDFPSSVPLLRQVIMGVDWRRRLQALWCVVSCCSRLHNISRPIHKPKEEG